MPFGNGAWSSAFGPLGFGSGSIAGAAGRPRSGAEGVAQLLERAFGGPSPNYGGDAAGAVTGGYGGAVSPPGAIPMGKQAQIRVEPPQGNLTVQGAVEGATNRPVTKADGIDYFPIGAGFIPGGDPYSMNSDDYAKNYAPPQQGTVQSPAGAQSNTGTAPGASPAMNAALGAVQGAVNPESVAPPSQSAPQAPTQPPSVPLPKTYPPPSVTNRVPASGTQNPLMTPMMPGLPGGTPSFPEFASRVYGNGIATPEMEQMAMQMYSRLPGNMANMQQANAQLAGAQQTGLDAQTRQLRTKVYMETLDRETKAGNPNANAAAEMEADRAVKHFTGPMPGDAAAPAGAPAAPPGAAPAVSTLPYANVSAIVGALKDADGRKMAELWPSYAETFKNHPGAQQQVLRELANAAGGKDKLVAKLQDQLVEEMLLGGVNEAGSFKISPAEGHDSGSFGEAIKRYGSWALPSSRIFMGGGIGDNPGYNFQTPGGTAYYSGHYGPSAARSAWEGVFGSNDLTAQRSARAKKMAELLQSVYDLPQ